MDFTGILLAYDMHSTSEPPCNKAIMEQYVHAGIYHAILCVLACVHGKYLKILAWSKLVVVNNCSNISHQMADAISIVTVIKERLSSNYIYINYVP